MRFLALGSLLLTGCLDFTALKFQCYDAGYCKRDLSNGPSLVSQTPLNNAMGVAATDPIVLTFSRAMDPATVTVDLAPPPNPLGMPDFDTDNVQAVFTPVGPLQYSTKYTATVHGNAADDGAALQMTVFTFNTEAPPDMVPPTLSQTVPMNGATNVAVGASLTLTFSEAMNQQSIKLLTSPDFDWGTPTWMTNGATVRFLAPPLPLTGTTDYTLGIDGTDLAGNPLAGAGTVIFTTAAPPDTSPPSVLSTSPPGGAAMVSPSANVNISVSFSEAMKAPEVTQALTVTPAVGGLSCALDVAGVLMTCSHAGTPLTGSTNYTIKLRTGADGGTGQSKDLAGNFLQTDFTSTFMTGATPDATPPTITAVYPDAGAQGLPYYPYIRVTFSEPMDKALTQAALVVSSPQNVTGTYSWDVTGKTVTFTPTAPQGGFPHSTTFSWQVGTGAKDLAGNSMVATQLFSFRVRRQVATTLNSLAADGYLRETTTYGAYTTGTTAFVGDTYVGDAYKTFLYFDYGQSGGIPTNALGIVDATLHVRISTHLGNPQSGLGGLLIAYSIPYVSPFTSSQWSSVAYVLPSCGFFCFPGAIADSIGPQTSYVKPHLDQAFTARRLLLRLEYDKDEDGDGNNDYIGIYTADYGTAADRPYISVTYEAP